MTKNAIGTHRQTLQPNDAELAAFMSGAPLAVGRVTLQRLDDDRLQVTIGEKTSTVSLDELGAALEAVPQARCKGDAA
jgi:hypothetical protein